MSEVIYNPPPLTKERMLYIMNMIKTDYPEEIPDVFYRMIDPNFNGNNRKEEATLWKDFLIRHGYINEKEEIIYKPENK